MTLKPSVHALPSTLFVGIQLIREKEPSGTECTELILVFCFFDWLFITDIFLMFIQN